MDGAPELPLEKLSPETFGLRPEEYSPEAIQDLSSLQSELSGARTIQHSGRVWQLNNKTGEFDIDLEPTESTLSRQERAKRPARTQVDKGLTPAGAQAALRLVQSEARYEQSGFNEGFEGKSIAEIESAIADPQGLRSRKTPSSSER